MTIGELTAEKFCMELGAEIKRRRVKAGLTQQDLAGRVGLHYNTLARYEGGADIPVMMFIRLCVALGARAKDVLDGVMGEDSGPAIRRAMGGQQK